jgi:dolichyl-diphosphooligosaccharide--protein glycosyltransferase
LVSTICASSLVILEVDLFVFLFRWDYGYQIAQIANRTTLADGNTWNHEHIALLGKILVSPVKESHKIVRHLADYVLVWSTRFVGNPGDDIAKSPHMARIGGSVFKDINPNEFYVDRQGRPSKMMYESLVYNLVLNKFDQSVPALPEGTFEEAYTSANRMVRIYKVLNVSKKSKEYCAENRGYQAYLAGKPLLDAYPPALHKLVKSRQDFAQLEDFNAQARRAREQEEKEREKTEKADV